MVINLPKIVGCADLVLDLTAGYRSMWRNFPTHNFVFLDIRREVKPDIIGNNEYSPFPDHSFDVVIYDPPHMVEANISFEISMHNSWAADMVNRYGAWRHKSDFWHNIRMINRETFRILKPAGYLYAKFSETSHTPLTLKLFLVFLDNFTLIQNDKHLAESHHDVITYYLLLRKRSDLNYA